MGRNPMHVRLAWAVIALLTSRAATADTVEPVTGVTLVRVPAGAFVMGSPPDEAHREAQERPHRVILTRAFDLARTEVTQAQWRRVMGTSPAHFAGCDDCPVESVSRVEVRQFLERLSQLSPAGPFRLPTEAEWEYACRAGTETAASDVSPQTANVDFRWDGTRRVEGPFRGRPAPVASLRANAWGLFDMHGNVWEWTDDEHCPYPEGEATDPHPRCGESLAVIRGGSWAFGPDSARCALRYTHAPGDRGYSLGFRIARDAAASSALELPSQEPECPAGEGSPE